MPEMSDAEKDQLREEIRKQRENEERLEREARDAARKIRDDAEQEGSR